MPRAVRKASTASTSTHPRGRQLRYQNLRYGCKLCPQRVFSQLSAPYKSKTRESAVEGHVRKQHPEHTRRWRKIAYRWGVRAYYTDHTTADIKNPTELPPVMEYDDDDEDEDEEEEEAQDDTDATALAVSGYAYADELSIDSSLHAGTDADRRSLPDGRYIKTENRDVAVYEYIQNASTPDEYTSSLGQRYRTVSTPDTDIIPQTLMGAMTDPVGDIPTTTFTSPYNQTLPIRPISATQRHLQPPIDLPPTPYTTTGTTPSTSLSPQAQPYQQSQPQSSYFPPNQFQPQPHPQHQTQSYTHTQTQLDSTSSTTLETNFDNAALAGLYGPRMGFLASQVFMVRQNTHEERVNVVGQYLQETRRVLLRENGELWGIVGMGDGR
ncbi:hypothetical protein PMZ80_003817 [Knufia obscura]|uniref:Uncharacterized protein n=2 Tax=Knufia TaxID=430999 RepID=A0AAN8ICC5_9EURO|nr:hypothetical protein PMZ80_003817 [Knufia obscura]KAK5958266.1 hypothetical protein OHC33_000108 [Knufia fluminis]